MWAAETTLLKDIDCGIHKNFLKEEVHTILRKGEKVTITKGRKYKYAVWAGVAIMDVPKKYINENTINVISA
jgi:hypothetical protein